MFARAYIESEAWEPLGDREYSIVTLPPDLTNLLYQIKLAFDEEFAAVSRTYQGKLTIELMEQLREVGCRSEVRMKRFWKNVVRRYLFFPEEVGVLRLVRGGQLACRSFADEQSVDGTEETLH